MKFMPIFPEDFTIQINHTCIKKIKTFYLYFLNKLNHLYEFYLMYQGIY